MRANDLSVRRGKYIRLGEKCATRWHLYGGGNILNTDLGAYELYGSVPRSILLPVRNLLNKDSNAMSKFTILNFHKGFDETQAVRRSDKF